MAWIGYVTRSLEQDLAAVARNNTVPVLLNIVCRSAGLGFAAVTCISDFRWIAAALQDDIGLGACAGSELHIETAIWHEIGQGREIIVVEDVAAEGRLRQHPAPAEFGARCYISVPILRADGSFFGSLCGFGPAPLPLRKPETVAMFETFAELLGAQFSASACEAELLNERKTSALREQFIAVLGHDLRNPLTAILGGMEMLRKNPLNQRAQQWAEMVVASAGRMAELIDTVVDFSRSRAGELIIDCHQCDTVGPGLQQLVTELQAAKPSRQIQSRLSLQSPIRCDPRRILQLAANLLSNAITHGDPEQPIQVEAGTQVGWFELAVTNAGEPIPEALLGRIFEPFSRGTVQPSREGMGLGLYISNQIAAAHGGTLQVASGPRETRFTFRMPLTPA
jgi:signal transduction histidine kinase